MQGEITPKSNFCEIWNGPTLPLLDPKEVQLGMEFYDKFCG